MLPKKSSRAGGIAAEHFCLAEPGEVRSRATSCAGESAASTEPSFVQTAYMHRVRFFPRLLRHAKILLRHEKVKGHPFLYYAKRRGLFRVVGGYADGQ